jgi:hypothetical protein
MTWSHPGINLHLHGLSTNEDRSKRGNIELPRDSDPVWGYKPCELDLLTIFQMEINGTPPVPGITRRSRTFEPDIQLDCLVEKKFLWKVDLQLDRSMIIIRRHPVDVGFVKNLDV